MTELCRSWLPRAAFTDKAIKSALSGPVGIWSERWFAHRAAVVSAVRTLDEGHLTAVQGLRIRGRVADADLPGRGKRQLLEAALDVDLATQVLGEGDHRVLDALAGRIVDDLVALLDETFGDDSADGARVEFSLSVGAGDAMNVSLPCHVLVPLLKTQLGGVRPSTEVPGSRMHALGPVHLKAEGLLGRAELALSDLDGLGVGDVLVLDKAVSEPVELRLCSNGRRIGQGKLGRTGGQVSIHL